MNRGERRRQLKEDERVVAKGLDSTRLDAREVVALMRVLRDKLRVCMERRSVIGLMHFIYANLADGAKHIEDVPIACRMGCSHCCHIWVDATPPEVFYAVRSLANRDAVIAAVEQACETTGDKSSADRGDMVTPCPLLAENRCSIYDARPINCRTAVSADAGICERSYLHISGEYTPTPIVWVALRQGYAVALEGALLNAGLVSNACEWNEALRLALHDRDAEARWLGGADVFAGVPRAQDGSFFDQPAFRMLYDQAFGS